MNLKKSRDTITAVAIFGLVIAFLLILAINNILYENRISLRFMLRCTMYGAPFITIAGMFNQYLVRWCNTKKWMLKNPHNTTVIQLAWAVLSAVGLTIFAFYLFNPVKHEPFFEIYKETYFQISIIADVLVNCFILMLAKYIDQAVVIQRHKKRVREVQAEIMRTRYHQLRAQVNPHFLFNSLNILVSLINSNPAKATEFTKRLSSIYRYLLSNNDSEVVLLIEELRFAEQYAKILSIRYGEGVKINIPQVTDVTISSMRIIPTALQILIENACKHNITSVTNPLIINVVIDNNHIIVNNNIIPRPIPADSTGLGLKGLKERYKIIADKEIEITQTEITFSVSVPLIKHNEIIQQL